MQRKHETTSPRDVKDDLQVAGKKVHLLKSSILSFISASTYAHQEKLLLGLDDCNVFARCKDSETSLCFFLLSY